MRISRTLGTKLFLTGGFLLFALGLFFISNRHRLFTKTFIVYADFDRLNGIEKGATVRLSGLQAGEVLDTEITQWPEGRLRLKLVLREKLHPFVRADSVASIRTSGLAGSTFLDIRKGTLTSPEIVAGGTLPTVEPVELADLMQTSSNLLEQSQVSLRAIQQRTEITLQTVTDLTRHADDTLAQMRPNLIDTSAGARRTAVGLSELTRQAQEGKGLAGEILTNPDLAKTFARIADNTDHTAAQLSESSDKLDASMTEFQQRKLLERSQELLESSKQLTSQLSGVVGEQNGDSSANLQNTLADARRVMSNLADDTEAAKHNFLLRGFFKNRGYYTLQEMNPSAYRSSKFLKGHTHERTWIEADRLFVQGPGDQEVLSEQGRQKLDAAMNTFASGLPNNALMIEGYSNAGSPEQQFRIAQHRAVLVRTYLVNRFSLPPDLVGLMPMGGATPLGSKTRVWNGISIVLIAP